MQTHLEDSEALNKSKPPINFLFAQKVRNYEAAIRRNTGWLKRYVRRTNRSSG